MAQLKISTCEHVKLDKGSYTQGELNRVAYAQAQLEQSDADKADTCAVIVAGGAGERFLNPGGKQLYPLCGIPMFAWSVLAFDAVARVGCIVLVTPPEDEDRFREALAPFSIDTPVLFAQSGATRQASAASGLACAPDNLSLIAVHDGARPLILSSTIAHALAVLDVDKTAAGVVCGHPSIDTLKIVKDTRIVSTPERSAYWVALTPQIFRRIVLEQAYQNAETTGFVGTDDASLVEHFGASVRMFESPRDNLKVTVPEDAAYVEAILEGRITRCSE